MLDTDTDINAGADEDTQFGNELAADSDEAPRSERVISLTQFVTDFGDGLLDAVRRQNPPVYDGIPDLRREAIMSGLKRKPFRAQADVVQAVTRLLIDHGAPAAIINADMGTGKTMMAICVAAVMHAEGYQRTLIISPPHLVYKWRREILATMPEARVWILNGTDTLRKLLQLKASLGIVSDGRPEFFVLGRVRMRMGFHWRPTCAVRSVYTLYRPTENQPDAVTECVQRRVAACPRCG